MSLLPARLHLNCAPGQTRKHSPRRAVKVVTFLTLPLEPESESPALQVCCLPACLPYDHVSASRA